MIYLLHSIGKDDIMYPISDVIVLLVAANIPCKKFSFFFPFRVLMYNNL